MKRKTVTMIGAVLGLTSSALMGQGGAHLKEMDKNGDGKISQDEATAAIWEKLSRLDANGDGAVGPAEMAKGRPGGPEGPGGGAFFDSADKNGDGKITADEAGERWERLGKADKDGDGGVTKMELAAAMGAASGAMFENTDKNADGKITADEAGERWERMSKADKDGDGGVTKMELAAAMQNAGQGGPAPGELFAKMDKDGNGGITEDEAPAEAWARMSKADTNADGKVTPDEMKVARSGPGDAPGAGGAGQKPKRPPVEP